MDGVSTLGILAICNTMTTMRVPVVTIRHTTWLVSVEHMGVPSIHIDMAYEPISTYRPAVHEPRHGWLGGLVRRLTIASTSASCIPAVHPATPLSVRAGCAWVDAVARRAVSASAYSAMMDDSIRSSMVREAPQAISLHGRAHGCLCEMHVAYTVRQERKKEKKKKHGKGIKRHVLRKVRANNQHHQGGRRMNVGTCNALCRTKVVQQSELLCPHVRGPNVDRVAHLQHALAPARFMHTVNRQRCQGPFHRVMSTCYSTDRSVQSTNDGNLLTARRATV